MKYMLMFYETANDFAGRETADAPAYWAGWGAYVQAVNDAGVMVSGHGLQEPATGTTVRMKGETRQVQDGPIADTKEQLAGYFIIEVPDLDAALDWAARAPSARTASVEIRPVLSMPAAPA